MIRKKILANLFIIGLIFLVPRAISAQKKASMDDAGFEVKGFHIDLRIQVMTPRALKEFAQQLADFGINTLVMEWEGTYPYEKHPAISNKYSYSRAEIQNFISFCEDIGVKVIPLQQSLGHLEYILRNPRYSELKEDRKDVSQLCPMEPDLSKELFTDLFTDLVKTHNSDYIHIGGDETYLLGHCPKCQRKVEETSKSQLFVDHMKMITEIVTDLGKKPVMWADIILKHPEAAAELSKETIFIDWNYGWKINHFGDIPGLQNQGFTFWGSPAIRSHPDNWFVTNWSTHFKNQNEFIPYGRKAGYKGMVMTSWSTSGVYGFTWDVDYDVVDMVQIRNTYPMSGFRILIASYAQALKQKEPLDPERFVLKYAKERFGLNASDSKILWQFFSAKPELIKNGSPVWSADISEMYTYYGAIKNAIKNVAPTKNNEEFAHYQLMADLRMHYLKFKQIEETYNSEEFRGEDTPELIIRLKEVMTEAENLNIRFKDLNKGFLYDAELEEQNNIRIQQVKVLYDRLAKVK